jgi:hypothetical protein
MRNPAEVRDDLAERFLGHARATTRRLPGLAALHMHRFDESHETPSRVHAVGLGGTEESPAVLVYVTNLDAAPESLPGKVDGIPVRLVESPMARLAGCSENRKGRVRPLLGGIEIGREGGPAGTLGAFAKSIREGDDPDPLILGNSHVFAPLEGRVRGTPIRQGGELVATVLRASRLHLTVPIEVDAAVARIERGVEWRSEVCSIGAIGAPMSAEKGMRVAKHGRTSGLTAGRVTDTGLIADVEDPRRERPLRFLNLIRVDALSRDENSVGETGDSGSLVLEEGTRRAVGLLSAVDPQGDFYYAHPIAQVCREMEIELLWE